MSLGQRPASKTGVPVEALRFASATSSCELFLDFKNPIKLFARKSTIGPPPAAPNAAIGWCCESNTIRGAMDV